MISGQYTARIANYLENQERVLDEALLEEAGERCKLAIKRQVMVEREESCGKLRMSSGGQCVRKQYYNYKGIKGEPLSARTVMTFTHGDVLESVMSVLGRLAGWQLTGKKNGEDEISLSVERLPHRGEPEQEPYIVTGHPDDVLYVPEENKYYVVEVKTMSDYSYKHFEEHGLDSSFGYPTQSSLYCKALDIEEYILVAVAKSTGHFTDRVYRRDDDLVSRAIEKWYQIINRDEVPERGFEPVEETKYNRSTKEYDPTGRRILGIQCSYCFAKNTCWPTAQVEIKSGRPVFVVPSTLELSV